MSKLDNLSRITIAIQGIFVTLVIKSVRGRRYRFTRRTPNGWLGSLSLLSGDGGARRYAEQGADWHCSGDYSFAG